MSRRGSVVSVEAQRHKKQGEMWSVLRLRFTYAVQVMQMRIWMGGFWTLHWKDWLRSSRGSWWSIPYL